MQKYHINKTGKWQNWQMAIHPAVEAQSSTHHICIHAMLQFMASFRSNHDCRNCPAQRCCVPTCPPRTPLCPSKPPGGTQPTGTTVA
mmetsp:Transcript_5219/g.11411  ORF Transcript_5219/g.11411 Transcript_5219/m.11411 type:complete len:87 (+) Transcript_5219:129-389(+)